MKAKQQTSQFAAIVYGAGLNARALATEYIAAGYKVVWCGGYAAVYR